MKTFKDKTGHDWPIDVNGETIARVKSLTGILLTELIGGAAADVIVSDPVKLMEVLHALCKPEAEKLGLDTNGFLSRLNGDALDEAVNCLIAEVIDFFPKARREIAQKLKSKSDDVQTLALRRATEKIDSLTPDQLLAQMDLLPAKAPGNSSGSSPEVSASIPAG